MHVAIPDFSSSTQPPLRPATDPNRTCCKDCKD